jgi:beta-N-acetylhexosaminidase
MMQNSLRSTLTLALAVATTFAAGCRTASPARPAESEAFGDVPPSMTPLTSAQQRRWVDSTLATLSLRERVGQMVMVWTLGDYTNTRDPSYAQLIQWVETDRIGGIAMSLGTPIEVAAKLNDIQRRARVPLIVGADLEPGLGRLEGGLFAHYLLDAGSATVLPPAMAIAATGRDEDAYDAARIIAQEGRAAGIHINFAPVVDVNNNPANPVINTRSFGEDPARVARLADGFVRGTQDGGMLATAKHFPGHGDTDVDSHAGMPVVSATMARLDSVELVPFRAAIRAGAALVMTAHIALPAIDSSSVPATLSPLILTALLRDSLHFRGTTITDAMTMEGIGKGYTTEESAVLAVKAGANILLKPSDPARAIDGVVAAVERGEITRARIDSAARHVLELKARSGLGRSRFVSLGALREVVGMPEHRAVAASIAERAITLIRDGQNLVPLRSDGRILVVQYAPETEIRAGRIFGAGLRAGRVASRRAAGGGAGGAAASASPVTTIARLTPAATGDLLDSIGRIADSSDVVVVAAYVRRVEGEGRFAIPERISTWIDSVAMRRPVVVVALGNPYLIRQFPSVVGYIATYGVSDDLERAAVRALLGQLPVTGKSPVSLPGFFRLGDGLVRPGADTTARSRR